MGVEHKAVSQWEVNRDFLTQFFSSEDDGLSKQKLVSANYMRSFVKPWVKFLNEGQ